MKRTNHKKYSFRIKWKIVGEKRDNYLKAKERQERRILCHKALYE